LTYPYLFSILFSSMQINLIITSNDFKLLGSNLARQVRSMRSAKVTYAIRWHQLQPSSPVRFQVTVEQVSNGHYTGKNDRGFIWRLSRAFIPREAEEFRQYPTVRDRKACTVLVLLVAFSIRTRGVWDTFRREKKLPQCTKRYRQS
jgi:hypothetical protein